MREGPKITVLICALNEEEILSNVLPKIPEWADEIILVDGHSTDRTVEVVKEVRSDIRILCQPGKGKGDALKHGFEHSSGDIIVTLDAAGSTDPEEMHKFIEPLLNGYDFAKGTRFLRRYTDLFSGYNAFWKRTMEEVIRWSPDGFENEPLINSMIAKKKLKVIEVGHSDEGRLNGQVKELAWRQGLKAIKTIVRERFCD